MKTIEVTVYKFDELSEEAQDKVFEAWQRVQWEMGNPWASENAQTLEKFVDIFPGLRLDRDGDMNTGGMADEILELKGRRLCAWLWSNVLGPLQKGKYRHMKTYSDKPHKRTTCRSSKTTGNKWREFRSAVFMEMSCPLTGYCMDDEILSPIVEFVTGTGYSRDGYKWGRTTLDDLIGECNSTFRRSVEDDDEYKSSREAFDQIDHDGELYLENGDRY